MSELFGGSLVIKDAFTSTFSKFNSSLSSANNSFKMFNNSIGQSERANRQATQDMKKQITELAKRYTDSGYTMQQAIKKATSEVSKQAPDSGSKWINAFGSMKQKGIDAFSGIQSKIQSFSNSTLGMITKITAGFISLKTVMGGLKTGFTTGMQYQDARITMDALYGDKTKGGQQFKMASDFANVTPWSQEETTKSVVKLKAYGLDDSKGMLTQMSDLGSVFKSSGKNINDATEAYADMMNGEWERMTEFGMKRSVLESKGKEMGVTFSNKKGQITNKENLANVFKQYMDDKNYTGMTKELSNAASGKLNTMTDNVKKSLSNLVGIADDGSVKNGSLFDKFIQGMDKFTTKMNSFTESANFDKISTAIGDIGGAISDAFSYLMDHPEIATGLLKVGAGIWALGKVSAVISAFSTIAGAFGAGGLLSALAPLAPYILAVAGGLWVLSSMLKPDGLLNNGIGWLLEKIPFIGPLLKQCWEEGSKTIYDFFTGIWDWVKSQFGFGTEDKTTDKVDNNWYDGKGNITGTIDKGLKYQTVSDMQKDGTITKASSNKSIINKTDVAIHIDKVEKTADVDEFMDTVTKRLDKRAQTRNNLE